MRDPKLLQADVKSLLMALVWCAYRDLELGVEDGVWLIPYKGKVTPVPAYKGLIKRATETGSVLDVKPYPIYQGDTVEVRYGLDEDLIHKPVFGEQRGALIGAAVVFVMPNGSKRFHLMYRDEVEKIRNSSAAWKAAPNTGPWQEWEEQMFLKTVIKRVFGRSR
jgi:recombination protein RecT